MSSRLALATATLVLAAACPSGRTLDTNQPVPEFSLEDANTSSASYGQLVSPSDFREVPSAWYFGHGS